MGKMYLEVVTSKYIRGTSMRNKSTEYVELDIDYEIPEHFASSEEIEEINSKILEVIKKYADENDVVLGIEYQNCQVGTNMYADQKYSRHLFVERGDTEYFRKICIDNNCLFDQPIRFNWHTFIRDHYKMVDGRFLHFVVN